MCNRIITYINLKKERTLLMYTVRASSHASYYVDESLLVAAATIFPSASGVSVFPSAFALSCNSSLEHCSFFFF